MKRSVKALSLAAMTALVAGNYLAATAKPARADGVSCRDYYASYIDEATSPTPTVIVYEHPHFHGHYPEYHPPRGGDDHGHGGGGGPHTGENGGGNNNGNDDAAIAAAAIGLSITSSAIAADVELSDAETVENVIDQAQIGDGADLRNFVAKVQKQPGKATVTLAQVAGAITSANEADQFCPAGDLDSEDEMVTAIAADVTAN